MNISTLLQALVGQKIIPYIIYTYIARNGVVDNDDVIELYPPISVKTDIDDDNDDDSDIFQEEERSYHDYNISTPIVSKNNQKRLVFPREQKRSSPLPKPSARARSWAK